MKNYFINILIINTLIAIVKIQIIGDFYSVRSENNFFELSGNYI